MEQTTYTFVTLYMAQSQFEAPVTLPHTASSPGVRDGAFFNPARVCLALWLRIGSRKAVVRGINRLYPSIEWPSPASPESHLGSVAGPITMVV